MADPRGLSDGERLLDRYTVLGELAQGGMASIYRAHDERLDRVVCIKVLKKPLAPEAADKILVATYKHFEREALALSKLQHPNTLRIYDYGYLSDDRRPFQVCEFMDGGTLDDKIRLQGRLTLEEALKVLEPIASAIEEAHTQKIIHRDIKPSNILFGSVGTGLISKIADFGIAFSDNAVRTPQKVMVDEPSISTVALFSPRWAAPEQLCGLPASPATDVYALALVLVYMMTGEVFFNHKAIQSTFNDRVQGDGLVLARLAELGLGENIALIDALLADSSKRTATPNALLASLRKAATRAKPGPSPERKSSLAPATLAGEPHASVLSVLEIDFPKAPKSVDANSGARIVATDERADLSFGPEQRRVRFRVSLLPATRAVQFKGLSSFVKKGEGALSPAVNADKDATISFISPNQERMGALDVFFSESGESPGSCVFLVDTNKIVIPFREGVGLRLQGSTDLVLVVR
jgi:eukaryotic-like serine/threonine-protein kinase